MKMSEVFSKGTMIEKEIYENMSEQEKDKMISDLKEKMLFFLPDESNENDYCFTSNTWFAEGEYRTVGVLRRVK